jgi:uncharacterized protein
MLPEGAKYGMCICRPYPGDPLTEALKVAGTKVGVIAIDLATRRRLRLNGEAERRPEAIYVTTQRVYANCPKYIQARLPETSGADASHRGGSPGFVRLVNENTQALPDYSGNTVFNTWEI